MADFAPTHPGEVLREDFLKPMGLSQYALAKAIGVPQIRVSEIVNGKRAVTPDTALLAELGFGLDLGSCAATGVTEGLAYVSPKTGRAVSLAAGAPWRERLLALPDFLLESVGAAGEGGEAEVLAGLDLTAHFLERHVFADSHGGMPGGMPAARTRLADRLRRGLDAGKA